MITTRIVNIQRRLDKIKNELFNVAQCAEFGPVHELLLDSFVHAQLALEKLKQTEDEYEA